MGSGPVKAMCVPNGSRVKILFIPPIAPDHGHSATSAHIEKSQEEKEVYYYYCCHQQSECSVRVQSRCSTIHKVGGGGGSN